MMKYRALAVSAALLGLASSASTASAENGEVNVYTYREHKLIQPMLDAFAKDTGIRLTFFVSSYSR